MLPLDTKGIADIHPFVPDHRCERSSAAWTRRQTAGGANITSVSGFISLLLNVRSKG